MDVIIAAAWRLAPAGSFYVTWISIPLRKRHKIDLLHFFTWRYANADLVCKTRHHRASIVPDGLMNRQGIDCANVLGYRDSDGSHLRLFITRIYSYSIRRNGSGVPGP
jgi:hypothetical protein